MKKIGLIGWTAPESTIMYYKKLTHELNEMNGGEKLPEISIESVDMYNILNQIGNRNCEEASVYGWKNKISKKWWCRKRIFLRGRVIKAASLWNSLPAV